ncbi:MAG: KUP/HAK/KT family potassium transporter [Puia sp.]
MRKHYIRIWVHCGKSNIRISWIYVKTCLILNYLGQGAWLLHNQAGKVFDTAHNNVFYSIMPEWVSDSGAFSSPQRLQSLRARP